MKVSVFKSISAKLFYYMSCLVLLVVTLNSLQSARTFMHFQTQEVQDTLQKDAEKARDQFEGIIKTWRSEIAVALPTLKGIDATSTRDAVQRFVDSDPEFVAFELFLAKDGSTLSLTSVAEAFTSNQTQQNFGAKDPVKVRRDLSAAAKSWLTAKVPQAKKSNLALMTLAKELDLPIMTMAVRFDVAGSDQYLWALLSVWQDSVIRALPKSSFVSSVIVDTGGRVFSSPEEKLLLRRPQFDSKTLVKAAMKAQAPSGFVGEYRDHKGLRRLGAFARVPKHGLAVLVEQDAEAAYLTLRRNLMSTALWGILFVLFAVMFSFVGAHGITKGLRQVNEATGRIASGDLKTTISLGSHDEVGMLGHSINNMARRISQLLESQVEKARYEKELETAKMVQGTFFPKADIKPSAGGQAVAHVTGFSSPASECGGDLWGHFRISEGVDFVFIGDVMGHGVPSALVTAMAYSTAMTIADLIRCGHQDLSSPSAMLRHLNRVIFDAVEGKISMTFFATVFDFNRGVLTYANAGHNFPVVVPADPLDERLGKAAKPSTARGASGRSLSLKLMSTPLGMEREAAFKERVLELRPGDKLFYFTDGLIECTNPAGAAWGRKKMTEHVVTAAALGADVMKKRIVDEVYAFFAGQPQNDDITVVVTEISPTWVPSQKSGPHATANSRGETATPAPPALPLALSSHDMLPPPPGAVQDPDLAQVQNDGNHPTAGDKLLDMVTDVDGPSQMETPAPSAEDLPTIHSGIEMIPEVHPLPAGPRVTKGKGFKLRLPRSG